MRIAMFTDAYFPRINGVAMSVHSYAQELSKIGHSVCVVCLEYTEEQQRNALFDEKSRDQSSPFQVIRVPSTSVIFSKEDRMARLYKWRFIKKSMDAFNPDVIHLNSEFTMGYFGALYARHRHVPYVFTFHTLWEDYLANYISFLPDAGLRKLGKSLVKFYLKRASVIVAPTRHIAEVVHRYGVDRPVSILPTGIPSGQNKYKLARALAVSGQLSKKFPAIKGAKVLLYVGRIVKEKNLSFLFDVLEKVQKTVPKTVLLLVGGGPYAEELEALASSRGLSGSVFFTGYVPSKDLIYFYRMSQVFVFASKTETQGLVTVEAMLAGLPVVAVGEMGTVDVMQGDHGGYMVHEDAEEFSEKVLSLIQNAQLRKQKSEEAKQWGAKWSISALTPKLLACYENAIAVTEK
ncbi:MAG: glycosyltransferase [Treponema sp.]|nr:glycosyltransferase [Treponema sp.]